MMNLSIRKTFSVLAIMFLFLACTLMPADNAFAKSKEVSQHIYDKAELLSTSQRDGLEDMCTKYSQKDNVDIIIMTHNDSNAVYAERYISDFYDKMLYENCVILLVDMANRDVVIEDYGKLAKSKISSGNLNSVIEDITPYLQNGDYTAAFEKYIKSSDNYINAIPIYENTFLHIGIAVIIGAIAVAIMAYNAGGKMTVGGSTYMDPNHSGLIGRRDDYIRTHITRVRKPENNNSGGGGGVSAGGHSYNSASGKF